MCIVQTANSISLAKHMAYTHTETHMRTVSDHWLIGNLRCHHSHIPLLLLVNAIHASVGVAYYLVLTKGHQAASA